MSEREPFVTGYYVLVQRRIRQVSKHLADIIATGYGLSEEERRMIAYQACRIITRSLGDVLELNPEEIERMADECQVLG